MLWIVLGSHANLDHENGSSGDEVMKKTPPWSRGDEADGIGLIGNEGDDFPSGRDAGSSSGAVKAPRPGGFVRDPVVETAEARSVDEDAGVVVLEGEGQAMGRQRWGAEVCRIIQGERRRKIGPPLLNVEFQRGDDALDIGPSPIDGGRGVEGTENVACYPCQFDVLKKEYGGG